MTETTATFKAGDQELKLEPRYDFIVCGSGSSGSALAGRLAENGNASVLVLEAGGGDNVDDIMNPAAWPKLRGGTHEWGYKALANPALHGRTIPMAMGKVLGGGSSINVMVWSRGHKQDWDHFASEADDPSWSYQAILRLYKRIEDWHGAADASRRGTSGPVYLGSSKAPAPLAQAATEAFVSAGLTQYDDANGIMMEKEGGIAPTNTIIRNGKRQSIFRSYLYPIRDQANLTLVTGALMTKVVIDGRKATAVEFLLNGDLHRVEANCEIILSLGAINTPKILMLSGVGNTDHLKAIGIVAKQHLPGVGENFQDHFMAPCVWQAPEALAWSDSLTDATAIWKSDPKLDRPDFQSFVVTAGYASPQAAAQPLPPNCWSLTTAILRTASPGRLRLQAEDPFRPPDIDTHFLASDEDKRRLRMCIEFCRDVGNDPALAPFRQREILPGSSAAEAVDNLMRNGTVSHSHQSCTAKMGRDDMSVVDGQLRVYGIDNLRVADASIMPRITTGNTMAPCVVIGERAAEILQARYSI
ncbi:GMC family oxidoreductase [Rhizobium sp. WYJ-E13]|uniref:GMC family oxidoreductase n=1 Tax=Rhizobium sp. WYJ-E13 TaxID=2849093 RepID=UPI001C1EE629|nr:GMC family oxidoreductase N-terminal domain-containing protein [Rhizobium sp. WYJ-E13]QWW72577.1 GMC family oxidoreductase N-terminal domain-containing protein [Rhizobium sp. WYJ-E13]